MPNFLLIAILNMPGRATIPFDLNIYIGGNVFSSIAKAQDCVEEKLGTHVKWSDVSNDDLLLNSQYGYVLDTGTQCRGMVKIADDGMDRYFIIDTEKANNLAEELKTLEALYAALENGDSSWPQNILKNRIIYLTSEGRLGCPGLGSELSCKRNPSKSQFFCMICQEWSK
jgi:hypothetical protein